MIYLQLFLSFLQIGALSFGGGYAAMPLIQAQIVTNHGWLSMSEFTDLVTIAEMTPGPIAVNSATFVGTKIGGILGALVATAGCILPACILVTLIARLYLKYRNLAVLQSVLGSLRPAVVAMIASAGILILISAFVMPFQSFANATYFTLRSGGKTFITFLFDSGFMWICSIPLAFCLSRFTALPILPLFAICQMPDVLKCVLGSWMLKKGSWIHTLT